MFHNFRKNGGQLFFKKLGFKKNDEVKFKCSLETNEEFISDKYGYKKFTDSYRFLSGSWYQLVIKLDEDDFKFSKRISQIIGIC